MKPNSHHADPLGPDHILVDGLTVPLFWVRSKRARRLAIRLDIKKGGFRVTLPLGHSVHRALGFLDEKADFLKRGLLQLPDVRPIADGAIIPFCGRDCRIIHDPTMKGVARLEGDMIRVAGRPEHLKRRVVDWLKAEGKKRLSLLVHEKAELIDRKPGRITLRDTATRWGSSAANGNLSFNWRLIMAPEAVQDYLAAHEVAHLIERNHGPDFWALVDQLTDHRVTADRWLKEHGSELMRIGLAA